MMKIEAQHKIGELVARDYRATGVFKAHGIDFCCNGNRTIAEACESMGLHAGQIIQELESALTQQNSGQIDFQSWPPDLLVDYIEKKHHRYVEEKIPEIKAHLGKIAAVHGDRHPELHEVERLFTEAAGALTAHMKKEELILFPFIQKLMAARQHPEQLTAPLFGSVENPIALMHQEHDTEGERFRDIARLSNNYTPPADACNTYRVAFAMLEEFEADLHMHIHLENNILFPMAVQMEKVWVKTS